MVRSLALLMGCLLLSFCLVAQERWGSIQGAVLTSDRKPASNVSVLIKDARQGTATDNYGHFEFARLKPGSYTILVSLLGYEPLEQVVQVAAGQVASTEFELKLSSSELAVVIVTAGKNKFLVKKSATVAKMPLSNLENPQAYSSVSKELIKEQMTIDFSNLVKNAPGVFKVSANRGINTDGATYYSLRGFRTEVSMVDGVPTQTNGEIDPANVEKVELLRGPSAALYGGAVTAFGGVINLITRKPQEKFGGEVSYLTGSFNLNRATADVYGPLNKEGNLLGRVNIAYQQQNSWQDAGFRKSFFVAPALEYRVNERLKINFNAELYTSEFTTPSAIFLNRTRAFVATSPDELHFNFKRSYTNNDLTMKNPTANMRAQFEYKMSGQWTSQTIISSNNRESKGYYQYQFIRKATDDTLERNISYQNTMNANLDVQQNFVGDFRIGKFRNRLLVGLDYLNQKIKNDNSPYIVFDLVDALNPKDPNYSKVNRAAVDARLAASTAKGVRNSTGTNIYSAYAADVFNVTDNLSAMLSLRVDRFESRGTYDFATDTVVANTKYGQTALSPKLGIVYQVIKDRISVFANYMNGFSNLAPVVQPLGDISGVMKPMQANQWETGIKLDLFNGKLNMTVSYYEIEVDKLIRDEQIERDNNTYNIKVQDGTQFSKGFEVEVIANPFSGLNLVAGYSHNNSKLTKSAVKATQDRRPPGAGPADLGNLWISYGFPKGKLKGLGAGFGGNYVGDFMTANSAVTGVFTIPSYTLLNATVFYETKAFRFGVKVDNLTDELYFAGQGVLAPQMPRALIANVTMKF
ncbi:MAG: TonB-dependent receptor [Candidatus Pseudobacter hemicellulosilyticus]|uniref:TonB-dependent receptor n=1 Tax=Candidatus Pseudobacter hemicellulosilyticus TaxID=3121375 RepID=A0AAJ6BK45_9BACT|nr:MAG: TonB-dependent receptor [Pseudobacter sp.]